MHVKRLSLLAFLAAFSLFVSACLSGSPTDATSIENTAQVGERLTSVPATNLFAISQMYWNGVPGGWLANGTTFCDVGSNDRCINEPTPSLNYHSHGLLKVPVESVTCPVLVKAELLLTTRTWAGSPNNLEIRRILKDWTAPAMPCSSNGIQSSSTAGWVYAKAGVAWSVPGAWGIGSDVSAASITVPIADSIHGQTIDVTSLVSGWFDGSAPNYGLWLASRDDADFAHGKHIGIVPSTWAIALECTEATNGTGGTGGATGSTTSSAGGATTSSSTSSTSTSSTSSTSTSSTSTSSTSTTTTTGCP